MPVSVFARVVLRRASLSILLALVLIASTAVGSAATVRGIVTDPSGAKVTGANISLISHGKVVASAISTADGSFEITTGTPGRFFLIAQAKSFRQIQTPGFYAGAFDYVERSLVLEPQWVRESIVVTATGTPTPQAQTSAATSVLGPQDLETRTDLVSGLRLMPGTFVVQTGQMGAVSSLFVRGGDSNSNKVMLDVV
jgi:iron complex outermembrane receptor protein/vitamin B12 transporter